MGRPRLGNRRGARARRPGHLGAVSDGRTVVVDPCGAADAFLRSGPEASIHETAVIAAMASSGFPVDSVDIVVMSHLDGIGMVGSLDAEGHWSPLFPKAGNLIGERELAHIEATEEIGGRSAFRELVAQGMVDAVQCPYEIVRHVTMEQTGGHSPGHCVLRIGMKRSSSDTWLSTRSKSVPE